MHALLIGLAGGAIGTFLVGFARLAAVPLEIAEHDRAVHAHDDDLKQWVADDHVRLKREVAATVKALNARKLFYSSELGFQVALVKERALQTYRDREKTAIRTVADIRGREGWPHLLYRTLRRQPFPVLTAPAVVEPVLDAWRAPITRHRKGNDPPAALDDPTARTIDDAIADSQRDPQALT